MSRYMTSATARRIRRAARDGRAARRCAARAGLPLETQLDLGRLAARMATLQEARRSAYGAVADLVEATVMIQDAEVQP